MLYNEISPLNALSHTSKIWKTIPACSGQALTLFKGQVLTVMTPNGFQVSDLFCVNLHDLEETFSSLRTIDFNDSIDVTAGSYLYSNKSRILAEVIEDTAKCHDLLMPPCSLKMYQIVGNNEDYHPSCQENLSLALKPYGIRPDIIHNSLNLFMNVLIENNRRIQILPSIAQPNSHVKIHAKNDLIVALTSCAHEETNNKQFREIYYSIK